MNFNFILNDGVLTVYLDGRFDTNAAVKFETDLKTLGEVDSRYGSLRKYLSECIGVTPEMMETLRERYLQ